MKSSRASCCRPSPATKAYGWLTSGLYAATLPAFRLYSRLTPRPLDTVNQRLGYYPTELIPPDGDEQRIWLHAASVGEVAVAEAIITRLQPMLPRARMLLSTMTTHGHSIALSRLGDRVQCALAPLDFAASVRRALAFYQPDVLVCLETEIWPNWLQNAKSRGVRTAMINGRISVRSVNAYRRIRPLIRDALANVDAFSMIHGDDAERLIGLGADARKVRVNGNAKFDLISAKTTDQTAAAMRRRYGLDDRQPVFVAGSTRGPEHASMLDVFKKVLDRFPETVMILAPRHIQRTPQIAAKAAARGLVCQMKTELGHRPRHAPVVILDTMGELQDTYSVADIVFCGGSLVPLGGQNILEPAVWSKPVLYGPSLEDFQEARALLERHGGGIQVRNEDQLASRIIELIGDPAAARALGRSARRAVEAHKGAARKHAAVIRDLAMVAERNGTKKKGLS